MATSVALPNAAEIAAPLFHPRFRRDANGVSDARNGPQTRSDLVLDSRGWTSSVIGNVSKWIDLDSSCDHVRWTAEAVFKQELAWASHLSLTAVVTPSLHSARSNANYARILNQAASQAQSSLQAWNALRTMSDFNPRVLVALEVTADLPDRSVLARWLGEPIAVRSY
ncbi:hypothetical protein DYB26_003084, partial [Aphanomyces astaci]